MTTKTVRIDLHCHSSISDGDLSPERVARELAHAGVRAAALTDHESIGGQERFRAALLGQGVRFISGAELQVKSRERTLHLLAYGFDLHDRAFPRALCRLRPPLFSYAHAWRDRLRTLVTKRHGLRLEGLSRNGRVPDGAAHDGDVSDSRGDSTDRSTARAEPLAPRADGQLGVEEAISLIHGAGGLACLAHPLTGTAGTTGTVEGNRLDELLIWLRSLGLDGIEAIYKPYSRATRQDLLETAERHGLLVTAGSDFHGLHSSLGASPGVELPEEHWSSFLQAIGGSAVDQHPRAIDHRSKDR